MPFARGFRPDFSKVIDDIRSAFEYFCQSDAAQIVSNQRYVLRRARQLPQNPLQFDRIMWERIWPAGDVKCQRRVDHAKEPLPVMANDAR